MHGDRFLRRLDSGFGVLASHLRRLFQCPAGRQVAVQRIVGAGLIGDDVGTHAAADQRRQYLGGVSEQSNGDCLTLLARFLHHA